MSYNVLLEFVHNFPRFVFEIVSQFILLILLLDHEGFEIFLSSSTEILYYENGQI